MSCHSFAIEKTNKLYQAYPSITWRCDNLGIFSPRTTSTFTARCIPVNKDRPGMMKFSLGWDLPIAGDTQKNASNSAHMVVSWNRGTSKSPILVGLSIINQPFWVSHIYGNPHIFEYKTYVQQTLQYISAKVHIQHRCLPQSESRQIIGIANPKNHPQRPVLESSRPEIPSWQLLLRLSLLPVRHNQRKMRVNPRHWGRH